MADKTAQLVLGALQRAATEPAGTPLYATRTTPGLFPVTTPARQAAQRCLDQGLLRPIGAAPRGKAGTDLYTLSERGLAHLLQETNPRQVLEDFLRALEGRQEQLRHLLDQVRQMQLGLEHLRTSVERTLRQLPAATPAAADWTATALAYLQQRRSPEDCPLPELFRHLLATTPDLTLGQFHDGLRLLHDQERLYLHPWTGPLYALPEPPFVLLIGHELAYYASIRR